MATTTTEPKLTPKQREVYDALRKGRTIPQIAKRLKITNSGVYGHIRTMRKAGVDLTSLTAPPEAEAPQDETPTANGAATSESVSNGDHQLAEEQAFIANAVRRAEAEADEHKQRVQQFAEQMKQAEAQQQGVLARLDKLQAARAALN